MQFLFVPTEIVVVVVFEFIAISITSSEQVRCSCMLVPAKDKNNTQSQLSNWPSLVSFPQSTQTAIFSGFKKTCICMQTQ